MDPHGAATAAARRYRRKCGRDTLARDDAETLPRVPMPSRPVDLDARPTVFLRFIVLHDLSRPVGAELGKKRRMVLKGMLRSQDSRCRYCGRTVRRQCSTIDHVIPRARGGISMPDNLTLACCRCNNAKGDWTVEEWLAWLEDTAAHVREFLRAGEFVTG
jgi:hypothetical protein